MSAGYRHYPITYNVNLDPIRLSSILSIFVFAGHLSYLKLGNVTQTEFDVRLATIVMEVILFFCSLQFYFIWPISVKTAKRCHRTTSSHH